VTQCLIEGDASVSLHVQELAYTCSVLVAVCDNGALFYFISAPLRFAADVRITEYFGPLVITSVLGLTFLWPPCVADTGIIFLYCGFFFYLLFFVAYSQPSQIGCLPYFHTWCGLSANLGCRSETCCTRPAENAGRKNRQNSPSAHHRTTLSSYIFTTKARIDNRKKNLLSSNISPTCPYNMANFG